LSQFQQFDLRIRMSPVPEGVSTDVDSAGPFEPAPTFANLEVTEYFRVTGDENNPPLATVSCSESTETAPSSWVILTTVV
jgi:hypothetical protein